MRRVLRAGHRTGAAAIVASPNKSNRAIAAEVGVSEGTVRTARKATAQSYAVEKRVGKDGKARKMPKAKAIQQQGSQIKLDVAVAG